MILDINMFISLVINGYHCVINGYHCVIIGYQHTAIIDYQHAFSCVIIDIYVIEIEMVL